MTSVACDLEQPVVTPRTLPSLKKNSTPITCISHWLCEISSQTNLFLKFVVFFFFYPHILVFSLHLSRSFWFRKFSLVLLFFFYCLFCDGNDLLLTIHVSLPQINLGLRFCCCLMYLQFHVLYFSLSNICSELV